MAEFYRLLKIEELDRAHPGLEDFVCAQYANHVGHTQMAALLKEVYGEDVSVQACSNYYTLKIWKRQNDEARAWLDAKNRFRVLKEEAAVDPHCDSAKMIELFTIDGIVQQRQRLAETDPLKLMAELRRTREAAGNYEIEKGKLEVAIREAGIKERTLEARIRELEARETAAQGVVKEVAAGAVEAQKQGREFDVQGAIRRISEAIGVGGQLEERVEVDE
jgi:hypothetical protein